MESSPLPQQRMKSSRDPEDLVEDAHWLKIKARFAYNPGAFFLRWDVSGCKQRIRRATTRDLPELRIALQKEEAKKLPRKRLFPFLRTRIAELETELAARAGRSITCVGTTVSVIRTLSMFIHRDAVAVYSFISNPENLPRWATAFCSAIRKSGDQWLIETVQGPLEARFTEKNEFGVADHYVRLTPEVEVHIPVRVLKNGDGSEVLFTIFVPADFSDEQHEAEIGMVERDLATLKKLLEETPEV